MAVQAYAKLREAIRRRLNDPAPGTFWQEDELDIHIANGIREWCERTKCLRAQSTVWSQATRDTYNMPPDFLELLRMEDEEGSELTISDFRALAEEFGTDFTATTGTPTHVYADLDGQGKFRLYPRPTASIDVAATAWTPGDLPFANMAVNGCICSTRLYLYAIDATYVYRFNFDLQLVRKVAHGAASVTAGSLIVATDNTDGGTYVARDTVFFSVGTKLYKMGPTDTSATLFGTSAETIRKIHAPSRRDAQFLLYSSTAKTYATATATYAEEEVSATFSALQVGANMMDVGATYLASRYFVMAAGSSGLVVAITNGSGTWTLTQVSATTTNGLHVFYPYSDTALITTVAPTVYLNYNGVLATAVVTGGVSPAATITSSTTVPSAGVLSGRLIGLDNTVYVTRYDATANEQTIIRIDSGVVTEEWYQPNLPGTLVVSMDMTRTCCVGGNDYAPIGLVSACLTYNSELTGATQDWAVSKSDVGEVVYADGVTFTQDEGIVVDVEDDSDATLFLMDSDEGAVTQWIEDTAAYTLQYVRGPHEDEQPLAATTGIEAFAVWQCLMNEDDRQNLAKADMHRQLYERELARALRQTDRGYLAGTPVRPRAYYF